MLGLVLVAGANAQSLKVKADIPFSFVVDKATLPAGSYSIDALSSSSGLVMIRGNDRKENMVVLSNNAESLNASPDTHLTFHRYGNQYFLEQIWVQGVHAGRQLRITRRETEEARNMQAESDVIVLAELR
jgi:hypothetical protein